MVKMLVLVGAIVLLAGCGGGSGSAFGGSEYVALPDGGGGGGGGGGHMNPEPTTLMLFGMGISGIIASKFRKKKK